MAEEGFFDGNGRGRHRDHHDLRMHDKGQVFVSPLVLHRISIGGTFSTVFATKTR